MKNLISLVIVFLFIMCPVIVHAQYYSVSTQKQSNDSWEYMGKVPICKIDGNEWQSYNTFGLLYGQFDGNNMRYKIYVAEEDASYNVTANSSYDHSKVEYARRMNDKYDNWKGPHPSIKERYPQKAGHWFLDVSNVWN